MESSEIESRVRDVRDILEDVEDRHGQRHPVTEKDRARMKTSIKLLLQLLHEIDDSEYLFIDLNDVPADVNAAYIKQVLDE